METFVVRMFVTTVPGESPFAGVVEHVGTTWSARFGSHEELVTVLRSWLEHERTPTSATRQEVRTT